MALGGGSYTAQNKVLPGAYFQFISASKASAILSERGVVAIALPLKWGVDSNIFTVSASDFQKNSMKIFGYDYSADEMKNLRELFSHATSAHIYNLSSGGAKSANTYATAACVGTRGNDLKVVIQKNVDDETLFDVSLYMGTVAIDNQTVANASELVDNPWVTWKDSATLAVTAGTALTGGTDGTANTASHQIFLDKIEAFPDTNAIGYAGTDESVKALYVAFAKRMRDEIGIRLQAVVYGYAGDSIACVNVKNSVDLVYWITGVIAGTEVNKSATNMVYDGELTVNTDYTQKQLEAAIKAGEFVLHQIGTEVHVLVDINSLTTLTEEQGEVFQDNMTVRVVDNIATSTASVFASKYIGQVPNNESGRVSLWSDVVRIYQNLADINAIEEFSSEDITVEPGETKKSIVINGNITVSNMMEKLYMRTVIA